MREKYLYKFSNPFVLNGHADGQLFFSCRVTPGTVPGRAVSMYMVTENLSELDSMHTAASEWNPFITKLLNHLSIIVK